MREPATLLHPTLMWQWAALFTSTEYNFKLSVVATGLFRGSGVKAYSFLIARLASSHSNVCPCADGDTIAHQLLEVYAALPSGEWESFTSKQYTSLQQLLSPHLCLCAYVHVCVRLISIMMRWQSRQVDAHPFVKRTSAQKCFCVLFPTFSCSVVCFRN